MLSELLAKCDVEEVLAKGVGFGREANKLFKEEKPAAELKRKELEILEYLQHTKQKRLYFALAESWNTYAKMLHKEGLADHYALAMTFVKYKNSYEASGEHFASKQRNPFKSWEYNAFLIKRKVQDRNWPSAEELEGQVKKDFEPPVSEYIISDLGVFNTQEVFTRHTELKLLSKELQF